MEGCMRSCEGVWECARMFKSVWGCVSTWEGMQGCARAYRRDCVRAFEAIWCHVSACQDVWECMSMGESVVGPARVCEGMRGHVRAWEYVCGCARVCECVQEHLRASEGMWGHVRPCMGVLSSVQFSHSVVSDSLRPNEWQHARPPCPSPTPGVHPNTCPLSWWCHPIISSSVVPFSSCAQSFPTSRSFKKSQLFTSGGQSIVVSASTSL